MGNLMLTDVLAFVAVLSPFLILSVMILFSGNCCKTSTQ
jgi:hypothetical protein